MIVYEPGLSVLTALPPFVSVIVKPGPTLPASGVGGGLPGEGGSGEREARGECGGGSELAGAVMRSPTVVDEPPASARGGRNPVYGMPSRGDAPVCTPV